MAFRSEPVSDINEDIVVDYRFTQPFGGKLILNIDAVRLTKDCKHYLAEISRQVVAHLVDPDDINPGCNCTMKYINGSTLAVYFDYDLVGTLNWHATDNYGHKWVYKIQK